MNPDLSILIVDDEAFIRSFVSRLLQKIGYKQIEAAGDGNVALGKLVTADPPVEVVICDLNMPDMNGLEFMGHAASSGYRGGLILLSGEDSRLLEGARGLAEAQNLNILGVLQKPVNAEALQALLANYKPVSDAGMRRTVPARPITENELREGLRGSATQMLMLVYQPEIDANSGEISGVETLARWWSQERGVLGPETFIPVAEDAGLLNELSRQVFTRATSQAAEWRELKHSIRIGINMSINDFANKEFCEFLVTTTQNQGIPPHQIVFEVSESQTATIPVATLEALMSLRLKRFGLLIDDFGTGGSALEHLKSIPFTELKVHRSFVTGAAQTKGTLAILEASITLARKLGMRIVAEGVETKAEWDLAKKLGFDVIQGFFVSRPLRNEDLLEFLKSWRAPA